MKSNINMKSMKSNMKSNINNEVTSQVSLLVDIAEDLDIEINYYEFQYQHFQQCLLIMKLVK